MSDGRGHTCLHSWLPVPHSYEGQVGYAAPNMKRETLKSKEKCFSLRIEGKVSIYSEFLPNLLDPTPEVSLLLSVTHSLH